MSRAPLTPPLTRAEEIDFLSRLNPLELRALILDLEDRWGIERAYTPPIRVVMGAPLYDYVDEEERFTVTLVDPGGLRVAVMKALRELQGRSLADVRALVDHTPSVLADGVDRGEVERIEAALAGLGVDLMVRRR